jgi:hypothetical protein
VADAMIKAGEYRIIYNVDGNVLKVFLIGKRNDDESYRTLRLRGIHFRRDTLLPQ